MSNDRGVNIREVKIGERVGGMFYTVKRNVYQLPFAVMYMVLYTDRSRLRNSVREKDLELSLLASYTECVII